jgi:ankyrin repeat protein
MAGNPDIVRLLLSAGAELETQVNGRTPFHIAAANGCVEILEVLREKGAQITKRDLAGNRPLCTACQEGHAGVVEKLLEYGEPLRMSFYTRPSEDSPLCIASRAGHLDVVRLLIQKGASVKQRDEFGYIPLRYAAYYGHPDVLQLLLEEGAELVDDGEDSHGWGFVLMPDMIGFSDDANISEDRRRRVRELLEEAERNTTSWNRNDTSYSHYTESDSGRNGVRQMLGYQSYNDQSNPYATSTRAQELHGSGGRKNKSELAGSQRTSELPGPPGLKYPVFGNPDPPVEYNSPASPPPFHVSPPQPHTSQAPPLQGQYLSPPVYYPYTVSPMTYPSPPTVPPKIKEVSYEGVSSIPEDVSELP